MKNKLKHRHVLTDFLCVLSEIPISFGTHLKSKLARLFQSYPTPFYYSRLDQVPIYRICWSEIGLKN